MSRCIAKILWFFDQLRGIDVIRRDRQSRISEKLFRLNRKFLKYVFKLLSIIFPKFLCVSTLLFIFLILVVVSLEVLIYHVGLLSGKFYNVLSQKNLNEFRDLAIIAIIMIIGNAILKSLSDFISTLLGVIWRKYLTLYLNEHYFSNKNFYYIQLQTKKTQNISDTVSLDNNNSTQLPIYVKNTINTNEANRGLLNNQSQIRQGNSLNQTSPDNLNVSLDNPDQRITQDVDSMCVSMSKITPVILVSPFLICYYTYQAWIKAGYTGPLAIFLYFIIGGILNGPLMNPIAAVVYIQDKLEGNFRYKHMSIRTHAESVAFYDSNKNELNQTKKIFYDLINISYRRNWKEFLLKLLVNTLQYLGGILSYLVLAIPIFAHLYDDLKPGELSQLISNYSFICSYLVYCFTRLYDLSNEISIIAGNSHRIGQLIDAVMNKNTNNGIEKSLNDFKNTENINIIDYCLITENLTVMTPDKQKLLIKNLNFEFKKNENILITGRSGCGKTSLLRVFSGLWKSYTGNLYLQIDDDFKPSNIFYLPQAPYFTNGSLAEQIIYPTALCELNTLDESTISCFKSWLKKFNLEQLLDKVNSNLTTEPNFNWPAILSIGEQQRLSFLRVLYHNPKYALLDEFTSSVDQETESLMYETLIESGITYLSIAHRDTVRVYHKYELKILDEGNYMLTSI